MSIDIDRTDPDAEPAYRPVPWPAFVAELLEAYKPPLRAPATYRGLRHALGQVTALAGPAGRPLVASTADLKPQMVAALIGSRRPGLSPHSVRALLRYVRTACGIAEDAGYLRVNPFRRRGVNRLVPAGRPQGRRHLSRAEIRQLLDRLAAEVAAGRGWRQWKSRRLQAVAALVAYTGLRRNEALALHVDDIDLAARIVRVRHNADRRLKTATSAADVPIPAAPVAILADWLGHRLDAPRGFKMPPPAEIPWLFPACRRRTWWHDGPAGHKPLDVLKAAGRRAGIGDVTFQMLRRSLATHLRYFGVGGGLASKILRHSEAVDEAWYHMTDAANMTDAVKDVDF